MKQEIENLEAGIKIIKDAREDMSKFIQANIKNSEDAFVRRVLIWAGFIDSALSNLNQINLTGGKQNGRK